MILIRTDVIIVKTMIFILFSAWARRVSFLVSREIF